MGPAQPGRAGMVPTNRLRTRPGTQLETFMFIRVIDFETTAEKPPEAEVCEFGICDVEHGKLIFEGSASALCSVTAMTVTARAVHNIDPAECAAFFPFDSAEVDRPPVEAFAAHNASFEQQFLKTDKPWICTYKAALRHWPEAPSHSNGALRYWLQDAGKISPVHELTQPVHRAGPDAYVTAHILMALLADGVTPETMIAWTLEPPVMPRCPLGKFRGKPWAEVEDGFLAWMTRQADMDSDLKWNAAREIERRVAIS
jgi:exodeoxyribonuclease X